MTQPPPRTKILRLITRLNVGGPARHVVWLTSALNNDEFETTLVTGKVAEGEDDMSAFATANGVNPLIVNEMSREISPLDTITVMKMFGIFRRHRPDIVHTHTAKAGTVGRVAGLLYRFLTLSTLIGRPRRCHFIHTYHGHIFHSYYGRAKTAIFLSIERVLARVATNRIVVLSAQQLDEIHHVFRIGRMQQFRIVPLGIDIQAIAANPSARSRLRAELGAAEGQTLVGIVGRLTAIKNHDLFLRVASHFAPHVRFAIFGDGSDRPTLEKRAAELNLGDRLRFAGVREPADIYSAIDVIALTSLNEGTPLALIEAMANGIPVVSTAVGGVVDLLGPVQETQNEPGATYEIRKHGITAASMDEPGFTAALNRMLRDAPMRERMSAASGRYVQENYSKDRLVADIMTLTRDLNSRAR
jgi:glycosyltransferase involved in cell wall biosynthesis